MNKRVLRKAVSLLVACVLAVAPAVALTGCANPADEVKSYVAANLDKVKNLDSETIDKMMNEGDGPSFEDTFGMSPEGIAMALFGRFDYTIDAVEVEGDNAVVTVTSTNVDLEEAMRLFISDFTEFAQTEEAQRIYASGDTSQLMPKIGEILASSLSSPDVGTVTGTTELALSRQNGEWDYDNSGEMDEVLYGGQDLEEALSNAY